MSAEKFAGRPWAATGETDAAGLFELETRGLGDGALLGKHTVIITKRGSSPAPVPGSPAADSGTPGGAARITAPGLPLIPEKYFSQVTSGLEADIKRGQKTINFELKD